MDQKNAAFQAPKTVSIIGLGRFGRVMARLLGDDFAIKVFDTAFAGSSRQSVGTAGGGSPQSGNLQNISVDEALDEAIDEALDSQVIFYCVPISSFEEVIKEHSAKLSERHIHNQLLIDTLSVKLHAAEVFDKYLPLQTQAMLTHPMFGPDGTKDGFDGQPIVIDKFRASDENYKFWYDYFAAKSLQVINMTADEHDRLAARGQGITHLVARMLAEANFGPSKIDPTSTTKLIELKEQLCRDRVELFHDMQSYNPYARAARQNLADSLSSVLKHLD